MGVCASTPQADAEPEAKGSRRKNVPPPSEIADAAALAKKDCAQNIAKGVMGSVDDAVAKAKPVVHLGAE